MNFTALYALTSGLDLRNLSFAFEGKISYYYIYDVQLMVEMFHPKTLTDTKYA